MCLVRSRDDGSVLLQGGQCFSAVIQTLDGRREKAVQSGDGRGDAQNGASRSRPHQKGRNVELANERVIHYHPLEKITVALRLKLRSLEIL
jgi:hypothetical protein